eukprot:2387632-Pleurochrysis_carterae.AAC.1
MPCPKAVDAASPPPSMWPLTDTTSERDALRRLASKPLLKPPGVQEQGSLPSLPPHTLPFGGRASRACTL